MWIGFRSALLPFCALAAFSGGQVAAQSYNVGPGQSATIPDLITDGTSARAVWVGGGGGTLILSNPANTYSGGSNVAGNSTLQVDVDSELGNAAAGIALGDAVSAGKVSFAGTAAISSARPITLNAGGGWILVNSLGTSLSGGISGPGSLTVAGGGVLTLNSVNSYTGATIVTGGSTLAIAADSVLGGYTTTSTVTNGVTTTTSTLTTANQLTLDYATLQFNGAMSISHPITLTVSGGSFNTNGFDDTVITAINGAGGLTKTGAGFLVLDGANSYAGGTVVNGGVLMIGDSGTPSATITGPVSVLAGGTLAGTGTIAGLVNNSAGIVSPGAGGSAGLTVANYVQGSAGSLTVPVVPGGAAALRVGGTAALAGNLTLSYAPGFMKAGTYPLLTASTITGGFTSVTGRVPSAGLSQTILNTPQAIDLVLTQLSTLPDRATIFPSLTTVAVDEGQQATQTLLDRLRDARAMALADNLNTALSPNHRARGVSPYGAWVQPTGNLFSSSASGSAPKVSATGGGFLGGIDFAVAQGMAVGVAVGYNRSGVDETGGANATVSVPRLAVYGDWWSGPLAIDAVVSVGSPSFDSTRPVTGAAQTATATHSGKEFSAATQASLGFLLSDWSVSPAVGAKYLSLSQNHFAEHGTDIYNFTVGGSHANSLRPFIDATVLRRFGIQGKMAVVPQLTVGYESEMLKTTRSISSQTQGDAATWVFQGTRPSRGAATMKADMTVETDKQTSYYVEYGRIQGSNSTADSFSAGFRYRL